MTIRISKKNQKKQFDLLLNKAKERLESAQILFKKDFVGYN